MTVQAQTVFTFRRPVREDVRAAARIVAAEETAVRGGSDWGVGETRDWWTWANLDESWIVEADGEPIAIGMVLDGAPDRTICWVSVDPRYNGRGLPHVTLGVDADNPTGATRLYERAGMRVEKEDVVFVKDLT